MALVQDIAILTLRPLVLPSSDPGGREAALTLLTERLSASDAVLAQLLRRVADQVWKTLEVLLAGETFWNGCQVFLSPEETGRLRQVVRSLRTGTPLAGPVIHAEDFRRRCAAELRAARRTGLLAEERLDAHDLVRRLGHVAEAPDPRRPSETDAQALDRLVCRFRQAQLPALASLLVLAPREGIPLLAFVARAIFQRELRAHPDLLSGLRAHAPGLAVEEHEIDLTLLADTLAAHAPGLREWLEEEVREPASRQASARGTAATPAQAAGKGSARQSEPVANRSGLSARGGKGRPGQEGKSAPPGNEDATVTRRQRLLGWTVVILTLALPLLFVAWLINRYSAGELTQLRGHEDAVTCLAFSPDGRRVLSGGQDRTVRLWDVEAGKELHLFERHASAVQSVAFSPDGSWVLSAAAKSVYLWNGDIGAEARRLALPSDGPVAVVFVGASPRVLATDATGKLLQLWDVETGKTLHSFPAGGAKVHCVALALDGRCAAWGEDKAVYLWDVDAGKALRRLEGHTAAVQSVAFSPDGRRLLSGGEDKVVRLWDVSSGEELRLFKGHTSDVVSLAFSADGRRALSGSRASRKAADSDAEVVLDRRPLRLWSLDDGKEVGLFDVFPGTVRAVALAPAGDMALSGSQDGLVRLWQLPE